MICGQIIGDIHINVCVSEEGKTFFYLNADNENVLPVLNYIENTLNKF